jgi:hypothetical protein
MAILLLRERLIELGNIGQINNSTNSLHRKLAVVTGDLRAGALRRTCR